MNADTNLWVKHGHKSPFNYSSQKKKKKLSQMKSSLSHFLLATCSHQQWPLFLVDQIDLSPILPASAMKPVNSTTNSIRLLYWMSFKHCHSNLLLLTSCRRRLPRTARLLLCRKHTNICITTCKYTTGSHFGWHGSTFAAGHRKKQHARGIVGTDFRPQTLVTSAWADHISRGLSVSVKRPCIFLGISTPGSYQIGIVRTVAGVVFIFFV